MSEDRKNVYVTLHKDFVRTGIEYADRATGETRTFNSVTLPKGTVIDGTDVGYYQFNPLFVNPSRFKGEGYRDIPLLANREVRLSKTLLDDQGKPVMGALDEARSRYLQAQSKTRDERTLAQRASDARSGASALANEHAPFDSRDR